MSAGVKFAALNQAGLPEDEWTVFSVGGGALEYEEMRHSESGEIFPSKPFAPRFLARNISAALRGPIVWEEDGPVPILYSSRKPRLMSVVFTMRIQSDCNANLLIFLVTHII